ncbi:helicase associated domain-containing protein [Streptomyces sp. NPDC006393]|uniref:helicase associated domain-containing protein n=1 Tax=Streptomyces sp. NPDC006393 TaxID=3156763 RepID=UPI0033D234D7
MLFPTPALRAHPRRREQGLHQRPLVILQVRRIPTPTTAHGELNERLSNGTRQISNTVSDAYNTLTKVLGALRAHDTDTIEALADPRLRNSRGADEGEDEEGEFANDDQDDGEGRRRELLTAAAAGLLRFSEERDPAALAQFVRLRVIDPERAYWRRGIEAATRWLKKTGNTELRVPYTFVAPEDWPGIGGHPTGVWVADQRRYHAAGTLEPDRVAELEALGMVWSVQDTAWAEGLAVARSYATAHAGMLLPPATAVWDGYPIGTWAKNMRAAARRTFHNAERRAAGETGIPYAGELPQSRLEALEAIDPGWCPLGWDIAWQRTFRLTHAHLKAGGTLPTATGQIIVQGEDLGTWVTAQRHGWDKLLPAQQWLLESTLGLEPAGEDEQPPARRSQSTAWARNLAAARQFHAREGHLTVPRKHIEDVNGDLVGLGQFVNNARRRAATLNPQRRADLDQLGMRW